MKGSCRHKFLFEKLTAEPLGRFFLKCFDFTESDFSFIVFSKGMRRNQFSMFINLLRRFVSIGFSCDAIYVVRN